MNSFFPDWKNAKTKKSCSVLTNEHLTGILRIATSSVAANVDFLCTKKHCQILHWCIKAVDALKQGAWFHLRFEQILKEERAINIEMSALERHVESWSQPENATDNIAKPQKSHVPLSSARDVMQDLPPEVAALEVIDRCQTLSVLAFCNVVFPFFRYLPYSSIFSRFEFQWIVAYGSDIRSDYWRSK